MSRVERIEQSEQDRLRRAREHRELHPNPRKISRTPGLAEGDELTVEEALRNQERRQT